MRKTLIASVAALGLLLSGCSASNVDYNSLPEVCGKPTDNAAVKSITATGAFGTKPKVTIPAPLTSKVLASHSLIEGTGRKFVGDQQVRFEFTAFNADTGEEFAKSKYDGTDLVSETFSPKQQIDFCKALSGAKVGSRVAILIPAAMAHKNTADAASGIKANDDIIFVMDIIDVLYPKALGEIASPQNGVPTVIRAENGQPSVQIPNQDPPTSTSLYTIIKSSDSQVVELGDKVVLKYSGFLWDGGSMFDSSWTATDASGVEGAPVEWELTSDGFITGFVKALTQSRNGQPPHVGDQILAVIPPDEAYGAGGNQSVPGNATLIFVIDILGVTKAKK